MIGIFPFPFQEFILPELIQIIRDRDNTEAGDQNQYPLLHVKFAIFVGQYDPAEQNNALLLRTSAQIFAPPQV